MEAGISIQADLWYVFICHYCQSSLEDIQVRRLLGDMSFHIEGDQFYYTNNQGLIYKLLPLEANRLMIPSMYTLQIHMIRERGAVTGMKFVYRDGREEFYPRTTESTLASQNQ